MKAGRQGGGSSAYGGGGKICGAAVWRNRSVGPAIAMSVVTSEVGLHYIAGGARRPRGGGAAFRH